MNNQQSPKFRTRGNRSAATKAMRLATGLLAVFTLASLHAQDDLPFASGSDGSDGPLIVPAHPTNRETPALGYDPARERLVLFGGNVSSTYYPETWISDGYGWERVTTDTFVSARTASAMAWDADNEVLLMFGGNRADGTKLNDLWAWDGSDWTEIDVSTRPPARYGHSLVTNTTTGDVYLLGGRAADNSNLNDMWVWNGTAWSELTEVGTMPLNSSFQYFAATYDAGDDAIVAYNSSARRTWKFKGGSWSEATTAETPACGHSFTIVYSPESDSCILFGGTSHLGQTWEFVDDEWALVTTTTQTPHRRYYHASAFDTANNELVITQGWMDSFSNGISNVRNYDTWTYSGGDWSYSSGRLYYFDMTEKANGIWNFTSIDIPSTAEVRFHKNEANTPVVWLAQESVQINGIVRVDGEDGGANNGADNYARGGPGGAAGGLGGIRFDVSGNYAGTPGQGAGGGAPGVTSGQYGEAAQFRNTYGNTLLLPLVGGSGGGGGASNAASNGGHGGGGGGAILIASSKDIVVNGTINADGGSRAWGGASYGGDGSGGAIKLMADRITGSGTPRSRGGRNQTNDTSGRIRMEAFFRPLAANATPPGTATAPIETPSFGDLPSLSIFSVDGENVIQPPTGNLQTPDVVFTAEGNVTIVVESDNIPEGTPVTLRITSSGEIINLPAPEAADITVGADGRATFTATVPAGLGTIQAFSEFTP